MAGGPLLARGLHMRVRVGGCRQAHRRHTAAATPMVRGSTTIDCPICWYPSLPTTLFGAACSCGLLFLGGKTVFFSSHRFFLFFPSSNIPFFFSSFLAAGCGHAALDVRAIAVFGPRVNILFTYLVANIPLQYAYCPVSCLPLHPRFQHLQITTIIYGNVRRQGQTRVVVTCKIDGRSGLWRPRNAFF